MLTITVGGVAYSATPDGNITPTNVIADLVGDLLDTGELIGPQTDEMVGVRGSLDDYPMSVVAAFLDVAERFDLPVGPTSIPDDAPVTAGLGDGGFDTLGNWHDPGSGEFAKPGTSTAKALIEHAFRKMLADAKRPGGVMVTLDRDYPDAGYKAGDMAMARYHDERHAAVYNDHRTVLVPWASLTTGGGVYARVRTPEGRETPTVPTIEQQGTTPLRYHRARGPVHRLGMVDPTVEHPTVVRSLRNENDVRNADAPLDYYAPTVTVGMGRNGQKLKTPKAVENPFAAAPGTVGFVDYEEQPDGSVYIHYMNTHGDHRKAGTGNALVHQLVAEHPGAKIDFGRVVSPGAWGILEQLRAEGVNVAGREDFDPAFDPAEWRRIGEAKARAAIAGAGEVNDMPARPEPVLADGAATEEWFANYAANHPTLVHVTSPEAARLVWTDGLRPGVGDARGGESMSARPGAVYLGDDRWAGHDGSAEWLVEFTNLVGEEYAVVEVSTAALDRHHVVPDEDSFLAEVDPEQFGLTLDDDDLDEPGQWADKVRLGSQPGITEAAVDERGTLAHLGPIPPEAITAIHMFDGDGVRIDGKSLVRGEANDMADRPAIAATTSWYETTIDGEMLAPNIRTADTPSYVLAARDRPGDPWRATGYSTAATVEDALAEAEASAPYAAEHSVGAATARTEAPPAAIRTHKRRDLDLDAEGTYRFHEGVSIDGNPAGIIRREDRGIGDETGPITALPSTSSEVLGPFDTRQDAIDAVVAYAEAHPVRRTFGDTDGTIERTAMPVEFARTVTERAAALNKRAERKGLTGRVAVTVGDPYVAKYTDELGNSHSYEAVDLTVTTTPVSLDGGWTFAGTVDFKTLREANPGAALDDPEMVLLHSTGGYQLPETFRSAAVCDDCGRSMPRNKLVVAADADGNLTRLGTTCVRDVLGHDPAKLLWFAEAAGGIADDPDGLTRNPPTVWEVEDFVAGAFIAADEFGWASAKSLDQTPTRYLVKMAAEQPRRGEAPDLVRYRELLDDPEQWAKARPEAAAAIAWVLSDSFPQRSEYEVNLRKALASQLVTGRTAGIAASLVSQWQRHKAQAAADAAREANVPNEWFGQPGDKIEMTGTVRMVRTITGDYGPRDIITLDTDRGVVKTFTASDSGFAIAVDRVGEGGTVRFKATIKDHDEFPKGSGKKETTITRAAHVPTRLDKLLAAEAEEAESREWRHAAAARGVMQFAEQAAYAVGDPDALGMADPDRQEWAARIRRSLNLLPADRLDQIAADAATARDEFTAAHPKLPYTENVGMEAGIKQLLDSKSDGMIVGYPKPSTMYRNGPTSGPLDLTGLAQVRRTGDTVDLVDPATGDVLVDDATLRSIADDIRTYEALPNEQRYGRTAIGDRPAVEKAPEPYDPRFSVVGKRGVKLPWDDTGYTVTVGRGDTERRVFIAPDGSVAEPLNEHESPWERAIREVNENAVRAQRTDMVVWLDAAVAEPYEAPADEGDVLNADNLAALTTPVEVTKGRKVYRIEAGGDVYTVPDGKRVTDKTGDPILRQALTDAGFEAPIPVAWLPEPPAVGEANDMPVRPTGPREVGSHEVAALAGRPEADDLRQALAIDPYVALVRDAWVGGDVSTPGATRAVQRAAASVFGLSPEMLGDTAAEDATILKSLADRRGYPADIGQGLTRIHANTQAMLIDAGIDPEDTLNLYRGVTVAQAAEFEQTGRPDLVAAAPLVSFTPRFAEADGNGLGGVITVRVPAGNVVSFGVLGQPDEVVAFPRRDGSLSVARYRSFADDAAAAASDIEVGEVTTTALGVKVLRTPSGFVDQATGKPVHADGTPIT